VQLLLVAKQQITASKASGALGAFERLLLSVGTLVALEVLEASKGALAGLTNVGPWLIGLWRGKGGRRLCSSVDGDGRSWEEAR
jgi:hypothetical protein